jgi:hypothetical protein
MSWTALRAYQQRVLDAYLWGQADETGPGQMQRWAFEPDKWAECANYIK